MLASALSEAGAANDLQRKKMIDEILAKRERDRNTRTLNKEARLRELNEQRFDLITKEETVRRRREVHDRLVDRGIEFLAEMELGKAPPREVLVQNLGIPADLSLRDRPLKRVIKDTQDWVQTLPTRIDELKKERERTHGQFLLHNRPYRGEADVRRERPDINPVLYNSMRATVDWIVDASFRRYDQMQEDLGDVQRHREYYTQKNAVLAERLNWFADAQASLAVTNSLTEQVVAEMSFGCASEIVKICIFAQNSILNIVATGLKAQRKFGNSEEEIKSLLSDLLQDYTGAVQHQTIPRN